MKKTLLFFLLILLITLSINGFAQWVSMATGLAGNVKAVASYNNEIYAGGSFLYNGSFTITLSNISKWNGTAWQAIGSGMNDEVKALVTFNGNLYAGGAFTSADGTSV